MSDLPPSHQDTDFSDFQSPHEASLKRLVDALDIAYHRPWLMVWRSFWRGFWTAIGAAIGTLAITLVAGYAFHQLGGINLLKPSIDKLQGMILQSSTTQTKIP